MSTEDSADRSHFRIFSVIIAFFLTLFALFRSATVKVSSGISRSISLFASSFPDTILGADSKEEVRPPSSGQQLSDSDLLSIILRRLGELEEKVKNLQTKPIQMPSEKEDLLHAAIYRVDALEAELITTKKALHEALMRQEELLAYIDAQEAAKFRENFLLLKRRINAPEDTI